MMRDTRDDLIVFSLSMKSILPALLLVGCGSVVARISPPPQERLRVLVLTDIGGDTDDQQSLVRFLAYANEFDIEGLIATGRLRHGKDVKPELIRQQLDAYGKVRPKLILHDPQYPTAESLLAKVKSGQPLTNEGPATPPPVGEGNDTEASEWIVSVLRAPDPRPLWVLIWGGGTDLAQALWKANDPELARRLRVYAINDQDGAMAWIHERFPDVFSIVPNEVYRGMYQAGDVKLCAREWVNAHVRTGHGPLGELYPEDGHGVQGMKEGDSPSILYLAWNGLGRPEDPTWGSWGGRFAGTGRRFSDGEDRPHEELRVRRRWTVARWREAYQNDFAARMDWQVKTYAEANHPPQPMVLGPEERDVTVDEPVVLDASVSWDPDGDRLGFDWFGYPDLGPARGRVVVWESGTPRPTVMVDAPGTHHLVLAVTDRGTPPLTRYRRLLLRARAK